MTTELTKAAQQAINALQCAKHGHCDHAMADEAIDALRNALTQRPAAQEVDGPIAASLGDIVAMWDQHAPSEYMAAIHMQAKRALAGQQPVSPDMHRWCAYVGGMVAHWITSEPDAHARLGDDAFEAAIAGIIERRLWAMPKTAPQQATPEPVGEPYAYAVYFPDQPTEVLVHDLDELTDDLTNRQHAITELFDRPAAAPAVPEDSALLDYLDTLAARTAGSDLHCFGGRVVLYVRTGIGSQVEASGAGTAREAIRAAMLAAAQAKGADHG